MGCTQSCEHLWSGNLKDLILANVYIIDKMPPKITTPPKITKSLLQHRASAICTANMQCCDNSQPLPSTTPNGDL